MATHPAVRQGSRGFLRQRPPRDPDAPKTRDGTIATIGQWMTDPDCKDVAMKRVLRETADQMPLGLPVPVVVSRPARPVRRLRACSPARARWWFDEMRRIVDAGLDFRATGVR